MSYTYLILQTSWKSLIGLTVSGYWTWAVDILKEGFNDLSLCGKQNIEVCFLSFLSICVIVIYFTFFPLPSCPFMTPVCIYACLWPLMLTCNFLDGLWLWTGYAANTVLFPPPDQLSFLNLNVNTIHIWYSLYQDAVIHIIDHGCMLHFGSVHVSSQR